ncbi:hypothetical protein H8S95_14800 [Pontibacter sp. KCTC 32443]|uniref:hypothetical protein n=1 Tax=Pontibacter TaxID=323449 RepID=UPI00164E2554|nr:MULTISPECIES: hypothetical protein [Pontibacter]MBC5775346.1 hypothetical protein [Pontibacter sp. KCTC 32443]
MNILNWKQKSWGSRAYETHADGLPMGNLTFGNWFSYDAAYASAKGKLIFISKGWFDQDTEVLFNGEKVAVAHTSLFGNTQIQLSNGDNYNYETKSLSRDVAIKDKTGRALVKFEQPALSLGKGTVIVADDLDELTAEMLISTGLYLKVIAESKITILVVLLMPLIVRMFD